ncbi:MAG: hypothetical protein Q9214_006481 [Letrouitia sp. 1 TL-2023]
MKKLRELERVEEEEAARERARRVIDEHRRKVMLEEYNRERHEYHIKEEDKLFRKNLKEMYLSQGYAEDNIDVMIEEDEERRKHHYHINNYSNDERVPIPTTKYTNAEAIDFHKPTYIRVQRKYLSPETLDAYGIPWEWDERWVPEHDQDILFEHTRKIREGRILVSPTVEFKKEGDQLLLVRSKSPKRERSKIRQSLMEMEEEQFGEEQPREGELRPQEEEQKEEKSKLGISKYDPRY